MAITNYSELKAALESWMDRSDISGNAAEFVSLAEARFNRELGMIETDVTLTGVSGSRSIDVSAYDFTETVGLFLYEPDDLEEYEVNPAADGYFPYSSVSGRPTLYAIDNNNIDFDCPLNAAYSFRWRYRGKLALSDANPTNKLLTDHPDAYLAACIVWGSLFVSDDPKISKYASLLEVFMREIKHTIAKNQRGRLMVDPALTRRPDLSWQW